MGQRYAIVRVQVAVDVHNHLKTFAFVIKLGSTRLSFHGLIVGSHAYFHCSGLLILLHMFIAEQLLDEIGCFLSVKSLRLERPAKYLF
ncbi:hypothetical protein BBOR36S_05164 [Brevibacillus borstelensis]